MRLLIQPDWAGDFTVKRTRYTAEQIIRKLKTAEQLIAQGKTVVEFCRVIEVTQPTYHRWRLHQLWGFGRQAAFWDADWLDDPLRELFPQSPEFVFEAPHQNGIKFAGVKRHTPGETSRIQQLQQGSESVAGPVVGRGSQKNAVLKSGGQISQAPGQA